MSITFAKQSKRERVEIMYNLITIIYSTLITFVLRVINAAFRAHWSCIKGLFYMYIFQSSDYDVRTVTLNVSLQINAKAKTYTDKASVLAAKRSKEIEA